MAIVQKGSLRVTYSVRDITGSVGKLQVDLPAATLLADAKSKADLLATDIAALTGGAVVGYNITAGYFPDTTPTAQPGSRVERKATFALRTAAGKISIVTVPAPIEGIINDAGGVITTSAAVTSFVANLVGGGWCDSNGSDLQALVRDYEKFRRTSKRQATTDTSSLN